MNPSTGARRRSRFGLAALALLIAAPACFSSATPSPFRGEGEGRGRLEIRVDNISFNDATIFALTQSRRMRLGVVSGKSSQRFTIEWEGLQDIQIEVDLLASQRFVSPMFSLAPGEALDIQVQEPVANTVVTRTRRR